MMLLLGRMWHVTMVKGGITFDLEIYVVYFTRYVHILSYLCTYVHNDLEI